MKVCLIRPPIVLPASNIMTTYTPPIGLAYVAGSLREAGFELCFIDALGEAIDSRHPWDNETFLHGLRPEQIVTKIPKDVGMIGIHAGFSFDWPLCRTLIHLIHENFPEAILVGGGEHVNAMPKESLNESPLDLIVCGEGEETVVEIAKTIQSGNDISESINGIVFRNKEGKFIETPPRARLVDIDNIAPPAWDITPIRGYLDRGFGFGVSRGRSMPIIASRGCPYQCTFCSSPFMWTTRWVIRDPDLLLDEMEKLMSQYGATNFDFYDLTFVIKKQWVIDFCQKLEERGLNITWQLPGGTRSESIDSEVAYWLYRSGCRNMTYTPESGSPSVLKRIKKKVNPESMVKSISGTIKEGINVKVNLIFGFPDDTLKETLETFKFIFNLALAGAHDLSIWGFAPYPGTELFDQLLARGRVKVDDDFYDRLRTYGDASNTTSYCESLSDTNLRILRLLGRVLFYSVSWLYRPTRPLAIIRNLTKGTHESRMEMGLAEVFRKIRIFSTDPGTK